MWKYHKNNDVHSTVDAQHVFLSQQILKSAQFIPEKHMASLLYESKNAIFELLNKPSFGCYENSTQRFCIKIPKALQT